MFTVLFCFVFTLVTLKTKEGVSAALHQLGSSAHQKRQCRLSIFVVENRQGS